MKVDLNLDIVWYYYISGTANDLLEFVAPLTDGSIITGGSFYSTSFKMYSSSSSDKDITFMRISSSGKLLWAVSSGGNSDDSLECISLSPNQEIIYTTGFLASASFS